MPCLSNLINSTASALPELKPIVYETRLGPKCNPAAARGPDPCELELGPQSEEFDGDAEQGEFRRNGEGEGADRKGPNPEGDPNGDLVSFSGQKLLLSGAGDEDGEGIERDSEPCRVQEGAERKIQEGFPKFEWLFLVGAPKLVKFVDNVS